RPAVPGGRHRRAGPDDHRGNPPGAVVAQGRHLRRHHLSPHVHPGPEHHRGPLLLRDPWLAGKVGLHRPGEEPALPQGVALAARPHRSLTTTTTTTTVLEDLPCR